MCKVGLPTIYLLIYLVQVFCQYALSAWCLWLGVFTSLIQVLQLVDFFLHFLCENSSRGDAVTCIYLFSGNYSSWKFANENSSKDEHNDIYSVQQFISIVLSPSVVSFWYLFIDLDKVLPCSQMSYMMHGDGNVDMDVICSHEVNPKKYIEYGH